MKKYLILLLAVMISCSGVYMVNALSIEDPYPKVGIKVKGACNEQDCGTGYKIAGTTYVPIRLVLEAMGATVEWNNEEQSVQVIQSSATVSDEDLSSKDIYQSKLSVIYSEVKKHLDRLLLLDHQITIAKELYESNNEIQWINQVKGKITERENEIVKLTDIIIQHQRIYSVEKESTELTVVVKHLKEIIDYYEFSIEAFVKYNSSKQDNDYKNYLLHRKLAIDMIEQVLINVSAE